MMKVAYDQALALLEYCRAHNLTFKEGSVIFRKYRIFEYIYECYDAVCTMGRGDLEDIEDLIKEGGYKCN